MNIIIENQILSPLHVYKLFSQANKIIIEQHDNYNKRSYRNRFKILSPNGIQSISIPLKKGKNSKKFKDVSVSYHDRWVERLQNTIKTCYGSSPYFDFYFDDIMTIFNKKNKFLFDLNTELRKYIFEVLEIEAKVYYSNNYIENYQEDTIDLRDKITPLSDNEHTFPPYSQVFEDKLGFISNISILDLVFNVGKYAAF